MKRVRLRGGDSAVHWTVAAILFGMVLSACASARKDSTAVEFFREITSQMRKAHARGDWRDVHAKALELVQFLNGSPDALLEVARADAHTGDRAEALKELRTYAQMGEARELVKTLPDFASLRGTRDFQRILETMAENTAPVSHARQAFVIPDAGLVPENIDYDPGSKRFFLTSILRKKIVTLDSKGKLSDFARAPDDWPMLAIKIDLRRRIVWATEVAMEGFRTVPKRDWGRSAVVAYDLDRGKMLKRIEGPRGSALGDMTLDARGDLLISDSSGGGIYLLKAQSGQLKPVDTRDFLSPQTPAYNAEGNTVFVPDYVRGIGALDLKTGRVRWIPMENRYALEGIDGMYFYRGRLIAVENGTSPERVMMFRLDTTGTRIISQQPIESGTPTLDPTHGVIVGDDFYYIANAGWNELDGSGTVKKGAALTRARIMRMQLPR